MLVVEDEKRLTAGLHAGLEAEGFAVDVAPTGVDGLWMAREHTHEAILPDIMSPGVNGHKICKVLRSNACPTPYAWSSPT